MLYDFHQVASDLSEAASLGLNAGIDVELPTTECYGAALRKAVDAGMIQETLIDVAVARHLRKKFESGCLRTHSSSQTSLAGY